eukprot:2432866-Prymnesium_polylepis.1
MSPCTEEQAQRQLRGLRLSLREVYETLLSAHAYYATCDARADATDVLRAGWEQFVADCRLLDPSSKLRSRAALAAIFEGVCQARGGFALLTPWVDALRAGPVAYGPVTYGPTGDALDVPGWLECIVRLSVSQMLANGSDGNFGAALLQFVEGDLCRRLPPAAVHDAVAFQR